VNALKRELPVYALETIDTSSHKQKLGWYNLCDGLKAGLLFG
jgi:hypothetical protein